MNQLTECIDLLAEIVAEDCRYRVASVRPSQPPNALQSVCMDLALWLISSQKHDSKVISDVAFAMIPAFASFGKELQPRLLSFFEGIVREVLENLASSRTKKKHSFGPPLAGELLTTYFCQNSDR